MQTLATGIKVGCWNRWGSGILFGVILSLCVSRALGQALPLAIIQDNTEYNRQTQRGVPISSTNGAPVGSDGRAPADGAVATPGQFQNVLSFSGSSSTRLVDASGNVTSGGGDKRAEFPVLAESGEVRATLRRATVGAPFLNRPVSFLFGSVIDPPDTDENGDKLVHVLPGQYWLAKPEIVENAGYYYSPHAQKVFAVQAGPVAVKWVKAKPSLQKPADFDSSPGKYKLVSGSYFLLHTQRYVVSG